MIIKVCVFVCTSVTVSALSKISSFIMKPAFSLDVREVVFMSAAGEDVMR